VLVFSIKTCYNIKNHQKAEKKTMTTLMHQNTPIYNITNDIIINPTLCPFSTNADTKKAYEKWRSNRVYLKSNRVAEQIVARAGGIHTRESKRRLSLSDSFWVKYNIDSDLSFESITPYLNDFGVLTPLGGRASSAPDLVLGGSQPKQWLRDEESGLTYMRKAEFPEQVHGEMLAVKLARKTNIPVMNAFVDTNDGRIYADDYTAFTNSGTINIINMTNLDYSLIQFDQMNIGVNGLNPLNVIEAYKKAGVKENLKSESLRQIIFDGVVGNIDRENNNSNWAIFMCNRTGTRSVSPMYDFNWANTSTESQIINKIAQNVITNGLSEEAVIIAEQLLKACNALALTQWESNAERLIKTLK